MKRFLLILLFTCTVLIVSAQTKIRQGSTSYGEVLYNWDGKNLRQGSTSYGTVIVNWDGKNIRQGSTSYGTVLCNIEGALPIAILIYLLY